MKENSDTDDLRRIARDYNLGEVISYDEMIMLLKDWQKELETKSTSSLEQKQ